jgi:hypothetical protein
MRRRADPCRNTSPHPSLADVQQRIGAVSSALFGLHDLSQEADGDSPACHFGTLARIIAAQLGAIWLDLDAHVALGEEVPDVAD